MASASPFESNSHAVLFCAWAGKPKSAHRPNRTATTIIGLRIIRDYRSNPRALAAALLFASFGLRPVGLSRRSRRSRARALRVWQTHNAKLMTVHSHNDGGNGAQGLRNVLFGNWPISLGGCGE